MEDEKALGQYTKIVVETDEEKPVTIAVIQSNLVNITEGYRIRLTPNMISVRCLLVDKGHCHSYLLNGYDRYDLAR